MIDDWIDDLMADRLYLAVHTVGQGGAALLHGDVIRSSGTGDRGPGGGGLLALAAYRRRAAACDRSILRRSSSI